MHRWYSGAVPVDRKILESVASELGRYVYLLLDPRDKTPFYVGKGQGLRYSAHLAEAVTNGQTSPGAKVSRIRDLIGEGHEPEVWILRYGLTESEYTQVEAAAIDLFTSFEIGAAPTGAPLQLRNSLTNARREEARGHGIIPLQTLIDEYEVPLLTTKTPLLLITLRGGGEWPEDGPGEEVAGGRRRHFAGWRPEWNVSSVRESAFDEIGFAASAWWVVKEQSVRSRGIEHVAVVHKEITRGLYRIEPGSWEARHSRDKRGHLKTRSAFELTTIRSGPLFDDVVGPNGHRVPRRTRNARQGSIYFWPPK